MPGVSSLDCEVNHVGVDDVIEKIMSSWKEVCDKAPSKDLQKSFEKELLHRFDEDTLQDDGVRNQIEEVLRADRAQAALFIQLASSHKRQYYTKDELRSLLSLFFEFKQHSGHFPVAELVEQVPYYDHGGKEWLEQSIKAVRGATASSQLPFLTASSTFKEMAQRSQGKGTLLRHNICTVDVTSKELMPASKSLSFHRTAIEGMKCIGNDSSKSHLDLLQLLKKADTTFSEQDQCRLLMIIQILAKNASSPSNGAEQALVYWYKAVQETLGDALFPLVSNPRSFTSEKTGKQLDFQAVACMLQWVVEIGQDVDLQPHLIPFHRQEIDLGELLDKLESLKTEIEARKYPEKSVEEVLKAFTAEEGLVSQPLSQAELATIASQFVKIDALCKELRKCDISELANKVGAIRAKSSLDETDKLTLLAIAREAIRLKLKVYPYNTQVLALLGILSHPEQYKGRIAQMRTGEGKSTVITMLAFYNACLGHSVDIISSSRYLAQRDQEKYSEFYQLFGITTSHICTDRPTAEHFKGQIIFGTNSDFEFAILWDGICEKRHRITSLKGDEIAERPFHVVIVDEVDNLFIDMALSSARISIPSKGKHGWVYQPILSFIKENRYLILLGTDVVSSLRERLCELQNGKFKDLVDSLDDEKLRIWSRSALTALDSYKEDHDYVVMPVEKSSWKDKSTELEIVLIDKKNTGRLLHGMRASQGVHEFLEAKHNLAIHAESAIPASLSHPVFFDNYQKIYGLTGTLGSLIEREEIERIYKVDTFDAPPHKANIRKLLPPIICHDEESYFSTILHDIQTMVQQDRPTLVLLESVEESTAFTEFLKQKDVNCQLLNERQLEQEHFVIARAGAPKMVTVATNTAGRGTDIILHPTSLKGGGLHVVFGFYPDNDRVEEQGFGRGGRQGQPGSCRMILLCKEKKTIQDLVSEREGRTQSLSESRMQKICFERINHQYLYEFLKLLRNWHDILNEDCLKSIQTKLCKITQEGSSSTTALALEDSEKKLAQEFSRYRENPHLGEHFLALFIQAAKHELFEKVLLFWAENFYGHLNDLALQNLLQLSDYRQRAAQLYESTRSHWERYLQDPVKGFWDYLQPICLYTQLTSKAASLAHKSQKDALECVVNQ